MTDQEAIQTICAAIIQHVPAYKNNEITHSTMLLKIARAAQENCVAAPSGDPELPEIPEAPE